MNLETDWELMATDAASGRQIFKKDVPNDPGFGADSGTYDFFVSAAFEVRDSNGAVLLKTSGSARGEYWCGVFLWFVEGSDGTRVRIDRSDDEETQILDVPDRPVVQEATSR